MNTSEHNGDHTELGAEYLNQTKERLEKARENPSKKPGAKDGAQIKRMENIISRFRYLLNKPVYMRTIDGWYCHVIVRDMKYNYGRVDLLVEQGDRVGWVARNRCYLPPGTKDRMKNTEHRDGTGFRPLTKAEAAIAKASADTGAAIAAQQDRS